MSYRIDTRDRYTVTYGKNKTWAYVCYAIYWFLWYVSSATSLLSLVWGDTVVVIIAVVAKCSLAIHAISSPNFSISDAIASIVPLNLMP